MKVLRGTAFTIALAVVVLCVVLLLNITAPNPTGRRYSSREVLTIGSGQQIGQDAETVLSADLHLPNNNAPDQLQCLCGNQ